MNIKELRKRLGLTQKAMAQKLGVDYHTIGRWEKGWYRPSPLALGKLEDAFPEPTSAEWLAGYRKWLAEQQKEDRRVNEEMLP